MLKIGTDEHGFMREAHIKLRPLETTTAGIFLAGIAQTPKDIPDTVSQASGAASKVLALLSGDTIELEPLKSEVVDENCDGCAYCIEPCPYDALTLIEFMRNGQVKKTVEANEVLCQGCGVCQATCPKKGIIVRNFKLDQLTAMVDSILEAA
jgi:heterodisulfide reductase subunit A